ncbi:MAG: hypothetical protein WDZ35_04665 [Crocinitomicaceae bacterium]
MNSILQYKSRYIRYFFVGFLVLFSCRKDPKPNFDCEEIPPFTESNYGFGYKYIIDSSAVRYPFANPLNSDEILCRKFNYTNGQKELFVYNKSTSSELVIYSGTLYSKPEWGKNNWIVMGLPDANIWKIKPDGDSLTQLTFNGGCFYPHWNDAGDKIIYQDKNAGNVAVIISENGLPLDTLTNSVGYTSTWQNNSLIGAAVDYEVYYFDITEDVRTTIYSQSNVEQKNGSVWVNNELHFSSDKGIFKVGLTDSKPTLIVSSCNAKRYSAPSVNAEKTKMYWQLTEQELVNSQTIYVKDKIVEMNLDGSNQITILGED